MTDDETPIGTAEAARLLGICTRKAQALIRSKKLDGWAIETPGGHVHAWRTTRAAVEAYNPPTPCAACGAVLRKGNLQKHRRAFHPDIAAALGIKAVDDE